MLKPRCWQGRLAKISPTFALRYLDLTIEGKQWIANLHSLVLAVTPNKQSTGLQS